MGLDAFEFLFFDRAREASKDADTFWNLRFIKKQKPAVFFEKNFYANELKVKNILLNVPDRRRKQYLAEHEKVPAISKILCSS